MAEHSYSPCTSHITAIGTGSTMLYLVEEEADDEIWLFQESNGHAWLQRQGAPWYHDFTGHYIDGTCWDVERATGELIDDPDFIVL